ncbi:hypothetical protein TIFTF001_037642 [Ficus carica]|uniref:Uncharacterized protein n=1 Tax=Ficus carica TaxID=3494 RepID=A0AA88E5N7_FICCA|nr:hypothetical protein TIFTF001_037638 [Ficus carica]GMN68587.1 hypothetical protein TIFTF001_037642 [Ficus carica]
MTSKEMCMKCNVLVVDSDPMTLAIVSKMLRLYGYTVSTTRTATDALSLAKKRRSGYQVILTDVHFPDMEKYEFIEKMKLFSKFPFVIMSAEVGDQAKYNGLVKGGAQLYLDKPVSMDDLKSLWQIAYRQPYMYYPVECIDFEEAIALNDDAESRVSIIKAMNRQKVKRESRRGAVSGNQENVNDAATSSKRPKLIWTDELHKMFLQAIDMIGIEGARPKAIQQLMNVPGLTRENISSHLQKYRRHLKREQDAIRKKTMTMARPIVESGSGLLLPVFGGNIPFFNGNNMHFSNVGNFDFGSSSGNPYSLKNFIGLSVQGQQPQIQLPPLEEGNGNHEINPGFEFDATIELFGDPKRFYSGGVP